MDHDGIFLSQETGLSLDDLDFDFDNREDLAESFNSITDLLEEPF